MKNQGPNLASTSALCYVILNCIFYDQRQRVLSQ